MKKWNLSVSDLGSWGVDALRAWPVLHGKYEKGIFLSTWNRN
jgi:hypothetical protein